MSNIVDFLKEKIKGDFYFTGSISLKVYGVIDRKPKDYDIGLTKFLKNQVNLDKVNEEDLEGSNTNDDMFSLDYENTHIDFFDISYISKKDYKEIDYGNYKIKVLHPKYSIKAKLRYVEKYFYDLKDEDILSEKGLAAMHKHIDDINAYNQWLKKNLLN